MIVSYFKAWGSYLAAYYPAAPTFPMQCSDCVWIVPETENL